MVKTGKVSVYAAARCHGVPISTLRDRVANRISVDTTKSGPEPVLTLDQEQKLCAHIKSLAEVGYGYTRSEVIHLASDYAVSLGKREADKPFSLQWYYDFMGRWPELKLVRPSSLSEQRARCASEACVTNYFRELNHVMNKYEIMGNPQNIYNIDEKGINTEYKPPNVVAGSSCKVQSVMAERGKTVTIIGAGNALGTQIPPYFIFPGERYLDSLLSGSTPGADGTMTKSGWSNSEVFKKYFKTHFMKYVQGRGDSSEYILVLYDGHRSHISLDLVDWALERKIILFVLPPHTSHILQPMDIGCFGPLQNRYIQECTAFARMNHRVVTRYDVCTLACKAYTMALSPSNLQAAFKRAGIHPLLDGSTMCQQLGLRLKPSSLYEDETSVANVTCVSNDVQAEPELSQQKDFFECRSAEVCKKVVKKRRNVSDVVGGKALEGNTVEKLKIYVHESSAKKSKCSKSINPANSKSHCVKHLQNKVPKPVSPLPGPSCVNLLSEDSVDSESELGSEPGEICCVCKSFYVPREKRDGSLFFVNWVGCDVCNHWVHLKFCTDLRVARKNTQYICPCCKS